MKKLITVFLSITISLSAQFSNWEYWDIMKNPVAGGDVWVDGEEVVYIFGGYADSIQTYVDWIQKYRPLFTTSKILDKMVEPRYGLVVERYEDLALFYGGIQSNIPNVSALEKWETYFTDNAILKFNSNFNRIFSTGHIIEDNFYIIGGNPLQGTESSHLPYIIEYNLKDSTVTFQHDSLFVDTNLPEQQMSEVIGDNIFIFGGVVNGISQDIYKFNITDKTFNKLDIQLIYPRAGGKAVADPDNNKIYLIGGYNENDDAMNQVEIFHYFGNNNYYIEESAAINDARYHFMAVKIFDYFYIFGGLDANGKLVNSVERYYFNSSVVDIETKEEKTKPQAFELYQNYPNPFNPVTTIKYSVPVATKNSVSQQKILFGESQYNIKLTVYNILGNEIATLVNEEKPPGNYQATFNVNNLSSGVYYYKLQAGNFVSIRKMILLK